MEEIASQREDGFGAVDAVSEFDVDERIVEGGDEKERESRRIVFVWGGGLFKQVCTVHGVLG